MDTPARKIKFVCPNCGCETLVRTQYVTELEEVTEIETYDSNPDDFAPTQELTGGEVIDTCIEDVIGYGCADCEFDLGTWKSEEVIQWLEEHGMIAALP